MATANFCMMERFPLFARSFNGKVKRCPECDTVTWDTDATECECCGCDELEDAVQFDEMECYDVCREVEKRLADFNYDLLFHKVSLKDGYYCGVQFYVEAEHDLDEYDYSNDDCHYYFDCCRSVAYRKYKAEKQKIARKLEELAKEYGFEELVCVARFSNGEMMYGRASNPRARLYAAVCA